MLRSLVLILACVFTLAACTESGDVNGTTRLDSLDADEVRKRHVDAVNAFRQERGISPVQVSARLTAASRTHARDMSVQERAWHFGSDATSPKDRAERAGYSGKILGENISESFDTEILVLQSWLNQPGARAVMLDPRATDVGVGWFQEPNGKIWWVQLWGQQTGPTPLPVPGS